MNLIALSIHRPVAVLSVVLMVVIFGWVALERIPIQMAPDVRRPVVSVRTKATHGYDALQLGFEAKKKNVNKPMAGVYKKAGLPGPLRWACTLSMGSRV